MLLPIKDKTPRCTIFQDLNNEVLHFLNAAIVADQFTRYLLSERLRDALWSNDPTKEQFRNLWNKLKPLPDTDRRNIYNELSKGQFLQHYYEDTGYQLPAIPESVRKALGRLCKHLFDRTSGLSKLRNSCGETLHESFGKFREINKNICCFCGSSELAQVRSGVEDNDQWRAANDHLLSKDEYPLFSVHPDNLVPLCETCNSKAKLAKDLLNRKRKAQPDVRRRCFFPFTESCNELVGIEIERGKFGIRAQFTMTSNTLETGEKLETWNEVYQIQSRVEGKLSDLTALVDSDCPAKDLNDFRKKIHDKAESCAHHIRAEGWNFWKCCLYQWLDKAGSPILDELWVSIKDRRSDADAAALYGI